MRIAEAFKSLGGGAVIGVGRTGAWDRKIGEDHMVCSAVDK